jgi:hypothetical protein
VLEHALNGVVLLRGKGCARAPRVRSRKERGGVAMTACFISDELGSGGWVAGGATRRRGVGAWGQRGVAGSSPPTALMSDA